MSNYFEQYELERNQRGLILTQSNSGTIDNIRIGTGFYSNYVAEFPPTYASMSVANSEADLDFYPRYRIQNEYHEFSVNGHIYRYVSDTYLQIQKSSNSDWEIVEN